MNAEFKPSADISLTPAEARALALLLLRASEPTTDPMAPDDNRDAVAVVVLCHPRAADVSRVRRQVVEHVGRIGDFV